MHCTFSCSHSFCYEWSISFPYILSLLKYILYKTYKLAGERIKSPFTFEGGCSHRQQSCFTRKRGRNNLFHFSTSLLFKPIINSLEVPRSTTKSLRPDPILLLYTVEVFQPETEIWNTQGWNNTCTALLSITCTTAL